MTSEVDICNMALAHIRAGRIESLTESSVQAQQCALFYEICRNQCLEDATWGFATQIKPLALLNPNVFTVFTWVNVYQYPSDCIKIQRLITSLEQASSATAFRNYTDGSIRMNNNTHVPYEVLDINGTTVIAADDSDLQIKYTVAVSEVNKFSSSFTLALSRLIAAHIAIPIAGEEKGSKLAQASMSMYRGLINNAVSNDMNQRTSTPRESEYITSRF